MTVTDVVAIGGLLLYGTFLAWSGTKTLRVLTTMVRPPRPAAFVCLHLTAVWTIGIAVTVVGLALLYQGFVLIGEAGSR